MLNKESEAHKKCKGSIKFTEVIHNCVDIKVRALKSGPKVLGWAVKKFTDPVLECASQPFINYSQNRCRIQSHSRLSLTSTSPKRGCTSQTPLQMLFLHPRCQHLVLPGLSLIPVSVLLPILSLLHPCHHHLIPLGSSLPLLSALPSPGWTHLPLSCLHWICLSLPQLNLCQPLFSLAMQHCRQLTQTPPIPSMALHPWHTASHPSPPIPTTNLCFSSQTRAIQLHAMSQMS
jgi:hypothetical protein